MIKKVRLNSQNLAEVLFLDAENHKTIVALAEEGTLKRYVAGFISYFDDDMTMKCSSCREVVAIRPWAKEIIEKYRLTVLCVSCSYKIINVEAEALRRINQLISKIFKT